MRATSRTPPVPIRLELALQPASATEINIIPWLVKRPPTLPVATITQVRVSLGERAGWGESDSCLFTATVDSYEVSQVAGLHSDLLSYWRASSLQDTSVQRLLDQSVSGRGSI